jgi:hypothetical protein
MFIHLIFVLFFTTVTCTAPELICYLSFDSVSGSTVSDESGNSPTFDGTLEDGGKISSPSTNKFGDCLEVGSTSNSRLALRKNFLRDVL